MVIGPKLQRLFYANIKFCTRFTASEDQYLIVKHQNGSTEHISGPKSMFLNPVFHQSIETRDVISLTSSNEALVVFTRQETISPVQQSKGLASNQNTLSRDVIKGPTKFYPSVFQTVHSFKGRDKILPLSQSFTFTIPLQSSDHVKVSAIFSLSVKIDDVEKLLDATEDLSSTLFTSLEADVFHSCSKLKWRQINEALRESTTDWTNLTSFAQTAGVTIRSIRYTNFSPGEELERREREVKKAEQIRLFERQRVEEDIALTIIRNDAKNEEVAAELELERIKITGHQNMKDLIRGANSSHDSKSNSDALEFLRSLKEMDVDLTKLLLGGGEGVKGGSPKTNPIVQDLVNSSPALRALVGLELAALSV